MPKKNYFYILISVIALCICLMIINYQIQRMIKIPFSNNLTHISDMLISPLSVIFFTSGIIWLCGSVYNCCTNPQLCKIEYQEDQFVEENRLVELQFNRINLQQAQEKPKQTQKSQVNPPEAQNIAFNSLPKLQILKIVIPNFLELLCFFYGIEYLSFPKVMIFKIISRLGLTTLYESLFTQATNKCKKFIISVLAFAGFAIFNYSFLDSPNIQKDQRLYKDNIVYGYMFVIGMCYLGLMKKIFEKQVNQTYGTWSGDGWILMQAKVNCVLTYLILLCLKEEIYGSVFSVLHLDFLLGVLGLTIILFFGMLLKKYIFNSYVPVLGSFVCILQKNLSLIASIIIFGQGINSGQILGVCLIALMAFIYFLLGFSQNDEAKINQSGKSILNQFTSSQKLFSKNDDDIKDHDEKKSLKVQDFSLQTKKILAK